ncbi:calcium-binding protein [uncultured Shimia sp.]|uniref:calcium-binding protein n=1 Tax=uncultured Shimia sp. TaxID=573152 RepID=UPI0025FA1418|nr:calcium-binding protein [uncultured Shimia sp.]
MPDDHSDTIAGATYITLGTDFSGTLDYGWDSDFFAIDLVAGQTYRFEFDLFDSPDPILRLGIFDADGTDLWQLADISDTALTIRPVVSGRYFIDVSNHLDEEDGSASYLGAYTGHLQIIDDDFPRQVLPSDGAIDPGDTVTGTIDYEGDTDEVALNVEENGIYRIVMNDATSRLDAAANQTTGYSSWTTGPGGENEMLFIASSDDLVEISIRGWTEGATYSYSVERIGTDDHSALHSNATLLQNGDAFDSNIAFRADVDVFEIVGVSGSKYTVTIDLDDADTLDGLKTSLRNMYDDEASAIITTTETQITLEWTFRTDTTYFLEVGTSLRRADYNAFGDYTISMSAVKTPTPISGDNTDELFIGTDEAEIFDTGGGNDTVHSGKGDDRVLLGQGDDYAIAGGDREYFSGGGGHDRISYFNSPTGVNINLATSEVSRSWAVNDEISGFDSADGSKTGNDVIWGNSFENTIRTHGGNDKVYAGKGDDHVFLGDGDDYVLAGGGQEEFHGGDGNDYISYYKSKSGVTLNLQTNEVSRSWADNDTISGFESASGSRTGNDKIYGTTGANMIKTYGGDDKVVAGRGNDQVFLGDGDDYVLVGGGQEEFHGGDGNDYISYYKSRSGVTLNLETNVVSGSWATNDTISGFESASGSKTGNDKIYGTSGDNTIRTYGGNDKVYARGGNDKVFLGDGNDYVLAGDGPGEFHGGSGTDYISYYRSQNGVSVNLETNEVSGSWAEGNTISGFENVSGSETGNDTIYGSSGANLIKTYGGNDQIHAGGGNDTVYAGDGNDQVFLGNGDDYVVVGGGGSESFDGGAGDDIISYRKSDAGVVIDLEANTVSGSWAHDDTINNFESAAGSDTGHDLIYGTSGRNYLDGFGGDDTLYGRDGNDNLSGRGGDDHIYGGTGDDRLEGGTGSNSLTGGTGADTFDFNMEDFEGGATSHTIIEDFENDVDTLEINSSGQVVEDIFSYAEQQGDDVVFTDFGNMTLIVKNITIEALQNDVDFNWI